ncbi:MAG: site-2 protease family protein [Betaproteobacteria bacterium]|nr:site-2 protease family protein [Betaproteobacteria bacterium]
MDTNQLIQTVLIYALPVIFAITLHEAAHGWMAQRLGDTTAAMLGRVTLNPMPHIDLVGTIVMPLLLYLGTGGAFLMGYAKPVPVQLERLRRPKRDMVWVALAGPLANLLQAFFWGALTLVLLRLDVQERFFTEMCQAGVLVNVVMFVFNMFPLPPLDGGRILVGLLPRRAAVVLSRVEPWGFFIVIGLVLLGVLNALWMTPLINLTASLLRQLLAPLKFLLF